MAKAEHPLLGNRDWLKARIDAGRTWKEIMLDAGLTSETVSLVAYYVRKHGLQGTRITQHGPKGDPLLTDKDWLTSRLDAGRSQSEIAREVGVSVSLVRFYLKRHGLLEVNPDRSERTKLAYARKYPDGRRGAMAGNWRGGKMHMSNGYIMVHMPDHPHATPAGYVLEHRYVMEQKIGRLLKPREIVDHIDRNRSNNHPDNLRLHASRAQHVKDHFSARDQLEVAKAIVRRYLQNHCENADAEGMSALCECRLCGDAREVVA